MGNKTYVGDAFSVANVFGSVVRYYDPPRTFGAAIRHRF
jgi:hypothetical protein